MSDLPAFLIDNIMTTDFSNEAPGTLVPHSLTIPFDFDEDAGVGNTFTCDSLGMMRFLDDERAYVVTVSHSDDDITYTTDLVAEVRAGRTYFGMFAEVTARYWKINFANTTLGFELAVLKLGKAVRAEKTIYGSHTPPIFNQTSLNKPSKLKNGQFLGRHALARNASSKYSGSNISASWVRTYGVPLQDDLQAGAGMFYSWRPDSFPNDVIYGFLNGNIQFDNTGPRDLMGVDFEIGGVV